MVIFSGALYPHIYNLFQVLVKHENFSVNYQVISSCNIYQFEIIPSPYASIISLENAFIKNILIF